MSNAVFCLTKNQVQTETVVDRLRLAGFTRHDISVLFSDRSASGNTSAGEDRAHPGASTVPIRMEEIARGILGWVAGLGPLAIPGEGPFIAGGPIMTALGGAAVGATTGGISGTLADLSIPENEATLYAEKIRCGSILVGVHTQDLHDIAKATGVLRRYRAEYIELTQERLVRSC